MSPRALRRTLTVLATIGVGLAAYLTYVHYSGTIVLCSTKGNTCEQVQRSVYSHIAGVPVALIGLIGYTLIVGSLLVRESETSRFATAALTLGGFGFSVYLTYREVFSLEKICEWCVGSACLMTVLMILSVWRFLRSGTAAPAPMPLDGRHSDGQDAELASAREPSGQLGAS